MLREKLSDQLILTHHVEHRMKERKITRGDVIFALENGKIIEFNRNCKPCPRCLVLGTNENGDYIHVVIAIKHDGLILVTTYHPEAEVWGESLDKKRR